MTTRYILLALIGTLLANPRAGAESATFTLDPKQSTLTLSGSVVGNTINPQATGSLDTTVKGSLVLDLTGNTIQFASGSLIELENNGSWEPGAGGVAGTAPGNFGGKASSIIGSAKAALRQVKFEVASVSLALADGKFDPSLLSFSFPTNTTSTMDFVIATFLGNTPGSISMSGLSTNKVATGATLAGTGGAQVLTLPIDTQFSLKLLSPGDTTILIKGKLVATRATVTAPAIQSVQYKNQAVTLQWTGAPGEKYQVLSSGDLKTWTPRASEVTSSTTNYSWTGNAVSAAEFLRLAK